MIITPVVPASDLKCPNCSVDWMKAALGPNCWHCGEPGIPGYVMPAVMSTGDPFVARHEEP